MRVSKCIIYLNGIVKKENLCDAHVLMCSAQYSILYIWAQLLTLANRYRFSRAHLFFFLAPKEIWNENQRSKLWSTRFECGRKPFQIHDYASSRGSMNFFWTELNCENVCTKNVRSIGICEVRIYFQFFPYEYETEVNNNSNRHNVG